MEQNEGDVESSEQPGLKGQPTLDHYILAGIFCR